MSSESNYSFTTKIDGQDLFTVRGDTYDEFVGHLTSVANVSGIANLLRHMALLTPQEQEAVQTVNTAFAQQPAVAPAFAPVPPPTQAAAPAVAAAPSCIHGPLKPKKGNSAKGEWRGYFCPTPQGTPDQCKPQFVQKGSPEWMAFPLF